MFLGETLCDIMEQLRPKMGNPLEFVLGYSLFYYYYVLLTFQKILS